ncbi:hypothetical protein V8C86DRAFT_2479457 [Haematococcus lacustris]
MTLHLALNYCVAVCCVVRLVSGKVMPRHRGVPKSQHERVHGYWYTLLCEVFLQWMYQLTLQRHWLRSMCRYKNGREAKGVPYRGPADLVNDCQGCTRACPTHLHPCMLLLPNLF